MASSHESSTRMVWQKAKYVQGPACRVCGGTLRYANVQSGRRGKTGRCVECARTKTIARQTTPGFQLREKLRKYKLTQDQLIDLFFEQGGGCAICHTNVAVGNGWQIDHDHRSGRVRGVLCQHCNTAIGQFKERVDFLQSAIRYLERHGK